MTPAAFAEGAANSGKLTFDSFGTPYSVRSRNILPLRLVEHPKVKAVLPYVGNAAYVVLASGFLMTDILTLRTLLISGYSGLVLFHLLHPKPLRIPLRWSAVFVALNAIATGRLLLERFPPGLTEEDTATHAEFFAADKLSAAQFKWLLLQGERRTLPAGTRLTTELTACPTLFFVEQGTATLAVKGEQVATIGRGGFVNDVAFQQGAGSLSYGTCDCVHGDVQVIAWDADTLRAALERNPALGEGFKHVLGRIRAPLVARDSARDFKVGLEALRSRSGEGQQASQEE